MKTNKSPINIDKPIYSLFHNLRTKRKPVAETSITICWWLGNQTALVKFLGVQVFKNVNQEQQINLVQHKISENFGIIFKARKLLEFK